MSRTISPNRGRLTDTPDKSEWNSRCRMGNHNMCVNKPRKNTSVCKCPCHITIQNKGNAE